MRNPPMPPRPQRSDRKPDGKADGKDDKKDGIATEAWRARFKAQRDQLARLEQELDVLQREENKAQVQYYPDPQKALSEGYTRKDINDKDTKIAAKKDEIAKQNQAISDLEDQLRQRRRPRLGPLTVSISLAFVAAAFVAAAFRGGRL